MGLVARNPKDHSRQFADCALCPIATTTKVFFRGKGADCRYLFVGEAPGPSECVTRLPFTGPAGKILDKLLLAAGLENNYGITNIIACYPFRPDNRARFRTPSRDEIENCKPRLDDLVETVCARFYIALGKVAAMNPPTGVTWHLELDHPSYILRSGGEHSVQFKRNKHRLIKFLEENQ